MPERSIAQERYNISLEGQINDALNHKLNKEFKSKESAQRAIEDQLYKWIKKGYVLAALDSIVWIDFKGVAYIYKGPLFSNVKITIDEKDEYLVRKIPRMRERSLLNTSFSAQEIADILTKTAAYLENNGYPFAKVKLDVSDIQPDSTTAKLIIEKGDLVRIKEIHIRGESRIGQKYVENVIGIKVDDRYNESRLRRITALIDQVVFLKEIKPHEILFTPEGAEVFLYLESNPVSLLNGVVGLQPDPVTGNNIITGDVRLKLQNAINKGELLDINWRSLQPQTTDLRTKLNYPFILSSPFGIDGKFELYQRDSTFITTYASIGMQYFMRRGNYLKAFFEAENSNLLTGAANVTATTNLGLPNNNLASVSSNRYGIGVYRRQINYLPNPSRGIELEIDGVVGRRTARRSQEDTALVTTTFSLRSDINWFIPLAKRHVLRLANRTRMYYAPDVFVNELFRFGGLLTQRGFDEEELFASTLTTAIIEYRFLVDQNSHAFLFYDQTFYENNSAGYYQDTPFGVGAGFSFGTNIGLFSISYGVGKQFDNPMLLRNGKVHFGYVSYF
jgi:outer membrane protein assembly factor BamA